MRRLLLGTITVLCLGFAASGCASAPRASTEAVAAAGSSTTAATACPKGKSLPSGHAEGRDYVDLVQFGGRRYLDLSSPPAPNPPPKLGKVLAIVRCSLFASDDPYREAPVMVEPGSTFVPVGNPIYEVAGLNPDCRVAAYSMDGKLHLYTVEVQNRPAGCPPAS